VRAVTVTPRLAILTGAIRAGKTTAALKIATEAAACGYPVGGFLSPDRRGPEGAKIGLDALRVADGVRRPLARHKPPTGENFAIRGPVVGPYEFDQDGIDWALAAFAEGKRAGDEVLFADELGRLEFERGEAFAPILDVLRAGDFARVLAVVRRDFVSRLIDLPGVEARVFELEPTEASRDLIPDEAFRWLVAPTGSVSAGTSLCRLGGCHGC
jgi:nucleoside-triphosphatase THEP1